MNSIENILGVLDHKNSKLSDFYQVKEFSTAEIDTASLLFLEFIKIRNCTDDSGNYVEIDYNEYYEPRRALESWKNSYPSVASLFTFDFPKEFNESFDLSKGIDSPVIGSNGWGLNIRFLDIFGIAQDESSPLSDIADILTWGILPPFMPLQSEYMFSMDSSDDMPPDFTIDKLFKLLAQKGLQYKPLYESDCVLSSIILSHNEKKKLESSLNSHSVSLAPTIKI